MIHFSGKYGVNGKEFPISEPGEHYQDKDIDADLAKNLADDFGGDDKSARRHQPGSVSCSLRNNRSYTFKPGRRRELSGPDGLADNVSNRVRRAGRSDSESTPWAGEALIDKTDLAPA